MIMYRLVDQMVSVLYQNLAAASFNPDWPCMNAPIATKMRNRQLSTRAPVAKSSEQC